MADLVALKAELTDDPLNRGYTQMDDVAAAESLNARNRQADRDTLTAEMLVSSIVESEFNSLTAREKNYLQLLVNAGSVQLNQTVKQQLGSLFPSGSQTRTNVVSLLKRPGSRADELGLGQVTPSHVADARR